MARFHPQIRRIFTVSLLSLPLLLSACGGGGSGEVACKEQYWDGAVGFCIPEGWKVVERERLVERGIPDDVIVAFQAAEPVSGEYPSVVVTKEGLGQTLDTAAYSNASIRSVSLLPGYQLVDIKQVKVDGTDTELHTYTAQPLPDRSRSRFSQISAVVKGVGYTATGFSPVTVPSGVENQVLRILTSFSFTEPKSGEKSS